MYLYYSLQDNALTPDPTDFMAIVRNNEKRTVEEMVEQLTIEGSILKKTECIAVINGFLKVLTSNIQQGIGFSSDHFGLGFSISGVFINIRDEFDPTRHQININLQLREGMKEAVAKIKTRKMVSEVAAPLPLDFYDYKTDTTNQLVSPGSTAELNGDLIKIEDGASAEQGIFLIHTDKTEYKVPRVRNNTQKQLSFVLPATMKKGKYTLEVRSTVKRSKEIRTGQLAGVLEVK